MTIVPQSLTNGLGDPALACRSLLSLATNALGSTTEQLSTGRIRGTGPGASFGSIIDTIEAAHPLALKSPFEGSDRVSGAVWHPGELLSDRSVDAAIAKLRWDAGADDLPMHVHDHSDRFIIVLEGRGFFHWSESGIDSFDGTDVQTIAARERDVFVFRQGLVHTFSTLEHPMTLISIQMPYLSFDDPRQYRLPKALWHAGDRSRPSRVACQLHATNAVRSIELQ